MKSQPPTKQVQSPSAPSPDRLSSNMMVALSGWPEPVYVSNVDPSSQRQRQRKRKETESTTASAIRILPHLDSGVVRDGFNLNPVYLPGPGQTNTTSSRPVSAEQQEQGGNSVPLTKNKTTSVSVSVSPILEQKQIFNKNIPPKIPFSPTATVDQDNANASTPTPIPIAPPTSIFATTCRHLLDPSLGPCPFPTHPHDIKALYPPTSHLPPGTKLKGKRRSHQYHHDKLPSSPTSSTSSASHVLVADKDKKDDVSSEYENENGDIKMGDQKDQVSTTTTTKSTMPPPPLPLPLPLPPLFTTSASPSHSRSNSRPGSPSLNHKGKSTTRTSPIPNPNFNVQGKARFPRNLLIDPMPSEPETYSYAGKGKSSASAPVRIVQHSSTNDTDADIDTDVCASGSGGATPSRSQSKLSISDMLH